MCCVQSLPQQAFPSLPIRLFFVLLGRASLLLCRPPTTRPNVTRANPTGYIFFSFPFPSHHPPLLLVSPASPRIDTSPQIHVSAKVCAVDVTGDQDVTRRSGKVFCMWCRRAPSYWLLSGSGEARFRGGPITRYDLNCSNVMLRTGPGNYIVTTKCTAHIWARDSSGYSFQDRCDAMRCRGALGSDSPDSYVDKRARTHTHACRQVINRSYTFPGWSCP